MKPATSSGRWKTSFLPRRGNVVMMGIEISHCPISYAKIFRGRSTNTVRETISY
jgi:hypothetical protein